MGELITTVRIRRKHGEFGDAILEPFETVDIAQCVEELGFGANVIAVDAD